MIAKRIWLKDGSYKCSNCQMRIPTLINANCPFCGDYFSNQESVMFDRAKANDEEKRLRNEDTQLREALNIIMNCGE